jgi:hypothetical protein
LGFEDKPEYSVYRRMFSELLTSQGHTYDYQYDWLLKKSDRLALLGDSKDEAKEEEKLEPK